MGVRQNTLDHIGRHFLYNIDRVVEVKLIQHLFQLVVGKALNQQFLQIGVHFHKGFGGQLLREQAENQRQHGLIQLLKKGGDIRRVHRGKHLAQGGVFFALKQRGDGF